MKVEDWGLIEYSQALEKQMQILELVKNDSSQERIVFCRHPSVVTLGRASEAQDILSWQGPTFEVQRGGRATYHGPGQIVVYPILDLNKRNKDLHALLRALENLCIASLQAYGLQAKGGIKDATGVWIENKKIASIGIAAKNWISYHGMAINIEKDPLAFQGISACGFGQGVMTSLEEVLNQNVALQDFSKILKQKIDSYFDI